MTHAYSPSTVPSVDGTGCLHRERLPDGTYSLRTCQRPERDAVHGPRIRVIGKSLSAEQARAFEEALSKAAEKP